MRVTYGCGDPLVKPPLLTQIIAPLAGRISKAPLPHSSTKRDLRLKTCAPKLSACTRRDVRSGRRYIERLRARLDDRRTPKLERDPIVRFVPLGSELSHDEVAMAAPIRF
jgi:hypothetical protein